VQVLLLQREIEAQKAPFLEIPLRWIQDDDVI
jgi:hypothetical protein